MNDTVRVWREGSQFGCYNLKRLLGHGGMGEVYEADDTSKQRVVALKVLPPVFSHDLVFCARLARQARIISRLDEPHIVPIHEHGEIDGQQFLDMPMIEGTDLSKLLKRQGALTPARAVAIVRQIASALDAAQAIGVMHGDVKPENILITRDDFTYLVDLGITDAAPRKGVTGVIGSAVRTWKYTAPERFTAPVVNHEADVYALTCVLHECLTGSPPYWADSAGALISAHLMDPVPRPSQLQPTIPGALDEVIARGMAKDPLQRYPSAGELALAAYQALSAPDQDRAADILESSREATLPDAEYESPSAPHTSSAPSVAPLQPSAGPPHPEPGVSASSKALPDPSSPVESPRPARNLPRFGTDGSGRPSEVGPPPPGPRPPWAAHPTDRRWPLRAAAAMVALIALSGVAIWLLRPSHPTSSAPNTNSTTSITAAPTPSTAQAQARLFSSLPHGYPPGICKPTIPPSDALAEVSCQKNSDPDGPPSATYTLYPDATSLRDAFDRIVQASTIVECPGRIQSPGPWHRNATPDKTSGVLSCATQLGTPLVGWTDDNKLLLSVAKGEPAGPATDRLYAWWMSHS